MNSNFADHVLHYWFGDLIKGEDFSLKSEDFSSHRHIWSEKDPKVDQRIADLFSGLHAEVRQKKVEDFSKDPKARLAAVIVLDQFSRHLFRGTAEMYEQDSLAREIVRSSLEMGLDQKLPLIARMFFYMPLMHSEEKLDHEAIVVLFNRLRNESRESNYLSAPFFEGSLGHANKHRDVILQFDRYPHRNKILGRQSSEEELMYLANSQPLF